MSLCSANNANLDKNNLLDNNSFVPNESRVIMLSCTEISLFIFFPDFEKLGSNPGFLFYSHGIQRIYYTLGLGRLLGYYTYLYRILKRNFRYFKSHL